jgi:hypothetical protein
VYQILISYAAKSEHDEKKVSMLQKVSMVKKSEHDAKS